LNCLGWTCYLYARS